jgi:hypothetical protein
VVLPANQIAITMFQGASITTGSYSTTTGTNVVTLSIGTALAVTPSTAYTGIIYTNGTDYWVCSSNLMATNSYVTEATLAPNTSAVLTSGSATGTNTFALLYKTAPTSSTILGGSGISYYFYSTNVIVVQIGTLSTSPTTLITSVQLQGFVVFGTFFFYGAGSLGGLGYIPTTPNTSTYVASQRALLTNLSSAYPVTPFFLTTTTATTTTGFTFVVASATGIVAGDFLNITTLPLGLTYDPSSVQVVSVVGTTITTNYSIVWGTGTKTVKFVHPFNTFNVYGTAGVKTFTNFVASTITSYSPITSVNAYLGYQAYIYEPLPVPIGFYASTASYNYYPPTNSVPTYTNTLTPYGIYNNVSLPNGIYSVPQINSYIENYMVTKNQYLTNTSTGAKLYYISLTASTTTFGNQFTLSPIPSSLPVGYTAPVGFPYSASGYTSAIVIPPNSVFGYNFGGLIGFSSGTYPSSPQTTIQYFYSDLVPNLPVTQIIVRCNMISNGCTTPDDILDVIPIANSIYGDDVIYEPSFQKWIALKNGVYSNFFIYFQDQNYNPIPVQDPNIVVSMLIKQGKIQKKLVTETSNKTKQIQPLFSNDTI